MHDHSQSACYILVVLADGGQCVLASPCFLLCLVGELAGLASLKSCSVDVYQNSSIKLPSNMLGRELRC